MSQCRMCIIYLNIYLEYSEHLQTSCFVKSYVHHAFEENICTIVDIVLFIFCILSYRISLEIFRCMYVNRPRCNDAFIFSVYKTTCPCSLLYEHVFAQMNSNIYVHIYLYKLKYFTLRT